jgi:N-methylhydantoinase B
MVQLIMNQLREPLAELDLRGQIVANQAGAERLAELFDSYGPVVVDQVMREGIDHVERRLRSRLRALPDGVWREVQYLDHDGHKPNLREIVCTITKRGDRLTVDFTGSAAETPGFANCTRGGLRAATLSAVCIMLGYDMTWNDGIARCVDLVAPPRTIVTAEYPTPVSMSTISAIIVTLNLVAATLSKVLLSSPEHHDEAFANWCGTSLGVSMVGTNDRGLMTVCPEASHFAAGCGARTYADGVDTGGIIINTTANIPSIEQTEAEYPVLYMFRRQLTDSGGAGRFRGGMSAGVAITPHDSIGPMETSFSGVGAEVPNAFGLGGGLPGAAVRFMRFAEADVPGLIAAGRALPGDLDDIAGACEVTEINRSADQFDAGSVEYHNWQGGGGYGDPLDRDPERVAADVRSRAVSVASAEQIYGVVVASSGDVDETATSSAREAMRALRRSKSIPARESGGVESLSIDLPDLERGEGSTTYGDLLLYDFTHDSIRCMRCEHVLGAADDDFHMGCLVEASGPSAAGPARGQDYSDTTVTLRRYYCPGCTRQLDATITAPTGPGPAFRLIAPTS